MIKLRHIVISDDIETLYSIFADQDTKALFINSLIIKSKEDFRDWFHYQLMNHYHEFRMIEIDGKAVGFCYSYDYRPDGIVKTAICIVSSFRNVGVGAFAELLFLDELFVMYPLRKIYNHVYSYNNQSLKSNLDGGFQIEGQLKAYRYYNGIYHDMYILAMSRETFYETHKKTLESVKKKL